MCKDCGLKYEDFPIDTVLTKDEWLLIHPEGEGGLLCAGCIVKRASLLPGIICTLLTLDFREKGDDTSPMSPMSKATIVGINHEGKEVSETLELGLKPVKTKYRYISFGIPISKNSGRNKGAIRLSAPDQA